MKKWILFVLLFAITSCDEKLIEKPENLIAKEMMADILTDMAIVNAAKTTHVDFLRKSNFEPTRFVFAKYGIDSVQFVESDRYYASIPREYEAIYTEVESKLEKQKKVLEASKKISDSLRLQDIKAQKSPMGEKLKKVKDSLP